MLLIRAVMKGGLLVGVILLTGATVARADIPCQRDEQCPRRTYCDAGRCTPIRRHINVLYLYYRSSDRRFTEVMGIYWHRKGEQGFRVGFPLYWSFWSPGESRRMLLPLYYDHLTPEGRHLVLPPVELQTTAENTRLRIWPLLFHSHGPDHSSTTVLPLVHHARSGTNSTLVLPPLLTYFRTDRGEEHAGSRGMVAGLFHWKREGDRLGFGLLPLFWHRREPGKHLTWVVPFNFHLSHRDSRTLLALPLLLHHRRPGSSTTLSLAPPLYLHSSAGRRRIYAPPLFLYHRTGKRRLLALGPTWLSLREDGAGFGVPPLFADWDAQRRWLVLFPALWHHRDARQTTWVAGPAFYHRRKDPTDPHLSLGLLPLYFHLRDRWREVDVAPPLLGLRYHQRDRDTTTWAALGGALLHHRTPSTSATVAFPLFWRFRDDEVGRRSTLLLPLGYHGHHPGWGTLTTVGPAFLHRGPGGFSAGVAPLLFAGRDGERRHLGLLPAFWHQRWARDHRLTWVAPFNFHWRRGAEQRLVLAPLLFAGWSPNRRHLVLPPLLWHFRSPGRQTWVIGPAYHAVRGGRLDLGLAPLVFYRRTEATRSLTVLPLFHHRASTDGARRTFLSPLWCYERDRTAGRTQWAWLAPLYYHRRDPRRDVDVMPPLFARWVDRERRSRTLVLGGPAVLHDSPSWRVRTLFPLLWDVTDRRRDRRTTAAVPLFYRRREAQRSLTVAGTAFYRKSPDGWSAGLAPLAFFGRDGTRRHRVVFPLFWQFTDTDRNTTVVGPYSYHGTETSTSHSLWPLLHYRRRGQGRARETRLALIPLFHFRRTASATRLISPLGGYAHDARRTTAVLGPLFVRASQQRLALGAVPLALATWERGHFARRHRLALLPLFYASRNPGQRSLYTPLFGFHRRDDPRSSTWYAGPLLRHRSAQSALTGLLPLFLHSREPRRGRTTLFVAPAYFGHWSPGESTQIFAPLLWLRRRPHGSTTLALPVLWDFHHRGVSRSTLVFPFYLRHRDEHRRSTTHLTHLVWVRRRPDATDTVVFPLLWHFGGRQRSSTVAFPLLWRFRRPERSSTVLFPVYWDFTRGQMRTTVALNVLYRRNRSKKTYDFHLLPLLRVQRKRPTDLKLSFLAGLFGYERIGANRFLKLFLIPIELDR